MSTHYSVSECPDWLCCPILRNEGTAVWLLTSLFSFLIYMHKATTTSDINNFDSVL